MLRYKVLSVKNYRYLTDEELQARKKNLTPTLQVFYSAASDLFYTYTDEYKQLLDGTYKPPEGGRIVSFSTAHEDSFDWRETLLMIEFDDVVEGHPYR